MKYAIVDIGSNSVRLMISQDLTTLEKFVETTALGQDLQRSGCLCDDAMARTCEAIIKFVDYANQIECDKILCFATEAVRSARNGKEFVNMMAKRGVIVDVVASEMEAKLGFWGAYTDGVCCVLDIGGASTELSVGRGDKIEYAKSLPIGLVRIKDACGEDIDAIKKFSKEMLKGYGQLPPFDNFVGIGGTPTSFVAIANILAVYDSKFVDRRIVTKQQIVQDTMRIHCMSMNERLCVAGLNERRRDVIVGGGILLASVMDYVGVEKIMARESDNQEGYLKHYLGLC
ncbi:MAG: hypothetical protein RR348_01600 [Clostridia bacterium]